MYSTTVIHIQKVSNLSIFPDENADMD